MSDPMTIGVTGGHGFIGSRVVRLLCGDGHAVRCLVRPQSDTQRIDDLEWTRCVGDLLEPATLRAAFEGCDAVIHLAGVSSWDSIRSPHLRAVVVEGTRHVLDATRDAGVRRVVYASSVVTVGGHATPTVVDETSPFGAAGQGLIYAEAKREAEALCRAAAEAGPVEVVTVSPTETYGADDRDLITAGNLVDILKGWPAVGCVGGTSVVHVDDVAAGVVAALTRGQSGEKYLLGGENLTIRALIEHTLAVAGQTKPIVIVPTTPLRWLVRGLTALRLPAPIQPDVLDYATRYWFVDNTRAREVLGVRFRPPRAVLTPTVRWLVEAGHLPPSAAPALTAARTPDA